MLLSLLVDDVEIVPIVVDGDERTRTGTRKVGVVTYFMFIEVYRPGLKRL